jgi:5-methylcytosine-specific restriction endonuclease McrBC regulatory subunit McrC
MNSLFEEFVWRLVDHLFPPPSYRVEAQERNWSVLWSATENRSYRSIRPDVVVREAGGAGMCVAIDAKYKRYDMIDPSSADIYQGFLYAQAYNATGQVLPPTGFLVYPASSPELKVEHVRLRRPNGERAGELVILGLPVRLTLDTIDQPDSSPVATLRGEIAGALRSS